MAVPHDPVAAAEAIDPRARMEVNMAKVLSFMWVVWIRRSRGRA
jgi:hypothetical protein